MARKDDRLKSAVELALERLREKDGRSGAPAPRVLTETHKRAIAEVRARYEAKIAEARILQADALRKAAASGDLEALETLKDRQRREIQAIEARREQEIQAVREKGRPSR